jgi:hypothetical protein
MADEYDRILEARAKGNRYDRTKRPR